MQDSVCTLTGTCIAVLLVARVLAYMENSHRPNCSLSHRYSKAEVPKKAASDPTAAVDAESSADSVEPDYIKWIKVGDSGGTNHRIKFTARDRNKDDAVNIVPADDPGLPNGAELIPPLTESAAPRTNADTTAPRLYSRTLEFKPRASQVNEQGFRVCMKARSYPSGLSPDYKIDEDEMDLYRQQVGNTLETTDYVHCNVSSGYTCPPTMWMDRCVLIKVPPAKIEFGCCDSSQDPNCPPSSTCTEDDYGVGRRLGPMTSDRSDKGGTLEFTAGDTSCSEIVELEARDVWVCPDAADLCPSKYSVNIELDTSTGNAIDSDVPSEFKLVTPSGSATNPSPKKIVQWTPRPGEDERLEGYQACIIAKANLGDGSDPSDLGIQRRCFTIRVRKCKYCLKPDETLADVGRRFQVDWLQIYMANPHISTPDNVPRQWATINTGVYYKVRPGDYLELIGQRFFMTESQLRLLNPDVPADGVIQPSMELCIMPPVCDVKCLYGTDCYLY